MSSATSSPNFEFVPEDSDQRPEPRVASRTRTPSCDIYPVLNARPLRSTNSEYFSMTGTTFWPSFWPAIISDSIVRSFTPLQTSSVSPSICGSAAISSAFDPHSRPMPYGRPASSNSSTTSWSWFTLIG